jgi:hypothetical protein
VQAGRYLEGLLGPVERKNGWQLYGATIKVVVERQSR